MLMDLNSAIVLNKVKFFKIIRNWAHHVLDSDPEPTRTRLNPPPAPPQKKLTHVSMFQNFFNFLKSIFSENLWTDPDRRY